MLSDKGSRKHLAFALLSGVLSACGGQAVSSARTQLTQASSEAAQPAVVEAVPLARAIAGLEREPQRMTFQTGVPFGHPRYHHAQSIQEHCGAEGCTYLVTTSEPDVAGLWVVAPSGLATKVALDTSVAGQPPLSHGGGAQLSGSLLAVALTDRGTNLARPAEGCGPAELARSCRGAVMFFDVSQPLAPSRVRSLDILFDLCGGDSGWPAADVQAVGIAPSGDGWLAAVLVSRSELQLFRHASGTWSREDSFEIPPTWNSSCEGNADWCWPSSINLYAEGEELVLLTFGRELTSERLAHYAVARTPFALVPSGITYLDTTPHTHMGAVGGSRRDASGQLTVFAASEHFCDDGSCMCTHPAEVAAYRARRP